MYTYIIYNIYRCEELYRPRSARHENIDGASFGTTFPHLFFLVFPELKPEKSKEHYVPRVFGFKLHHTWHQRSIEAARKAQYEYQQEQRRRAQAKQRQQQIEMEQRKILQQNQQNNNISNQKR